MAVMLNQRTIRNREKRREMCACKLVLTLDILLLLSVVLKIEIQFFFYFNSFCQTWFSSTADIYKPTSYFYSETDG